MAIVNRSRIVLRCPNDLAWSREGAARIEPSLNPSPLLELVKENANCRKHALFCVRGHWLAGPGLKSGQSVEVTYAALINVADVGERET